MSRQALRWLQRFGDRHAIKIAFTLIVAVAVVAVAGVRWEANNRADQVQAESEQRAIDVERAATERRGQICAEARNLRALVSELIDTAVGEGGSSGLPLTELPTFAALPESVQAYLQELAAASAASPEDQPDLATRLRSFQESRLAELPDFCTEGG